jgi:hypothetical protein
MKDGLFCYPDLVRSERRSIMSNQRSSLTASRGRAKANRWQGLEPKLGFLEVSRLEERVTEELKAWGFEEEGQL